MAVVRAQSTRPRASPAIRAFSRMAPLSTRGWRPFSRVMSNTELKVQDLAQATYQVNTTGSITLLAVPITGADFNARIGRKIKLKSLFIRGRIRLECTSSPDTAVAVAAQQGRLMIVYDLQPNGVIAGITDILNTAEPASHLNLNNRDRFRILYDREFVFDPYVVDKTATASYSNAGRSIHNVKLYKKLNYDMIFNSVNGGTIADIASGALLMVWVGSAIAGTTDCLFIGGTRVRYADN